MYYTVDKEIAMNKKMMLQKMILHALFKRKSRIAVALFAIAIGTAVIFSLLSVYLDINEKMSKELRAYGANLVIAPSDSGEPFLTEQQFNETLAVLENNVVGAAPYLYGVVNISNKQLVMVGTDFSEIEKISPYWKINGIWVSDKNLDGAIIGVTVAEKLKLNLGDQFSAISDTTGQKNTFTVKAIVKTGSTEDNQIFVNLVPFQNMLQLEGLMNVGYISASGEANFLTEKAKEISNQQPSLIAKPIKKIAQSEGIILEKIKSLVYLVVTVVLMSTILCVATTMMTIVLEREKEIGLKKALGAPNLSIVSEFLGEAILLGTCGALIGSFLGYLFAQIIGQSVFMEAISFKFSVFLIVIIASVFVTSIAALWPVRTVVSIEPAVVLKGE